MDQNTRDPSKQARKPEIPNDPLLRLVGPGKHIWANEPADDYVNGLRDDSYD
ncbi:MAG TPA: hypothetical protein VKT53_10365 [Candidatus Acidoferrum sp.]|nr:hypothetical protein [Candidatus Acidoferrum sp.]